MENNIFSETKSKISLEALIGDHVALQEAGEGFMKGPCPYRDINDSEHEFVVYLKKQVFYCPLCRDGGDSIYFIAKKMSMSPWRAVEHIKSKYLGD